MIESFKLFNPLFQTLEFLLWFLLLLILFYSIQKCYYFAIKYFSMKYIDKTSNYLSILQYYITKAYDIIYKEKIIIYSMESVKLNKTEYNEYSKEYVLLLKKLMGNNLLLEFYNFFGTEESFYFFVLNEFNIKYEDDEIRKESINNLQNS
jgi:hypothetical protein